VSLVHLTRRSFYFLASHNVPCGHEESGLPYWRSMWTVGMFDVSALLRIRVFSLIEPTVAFGIWTQQPSLPETVLSVFLL
jgi:hypothetical protein